MVNLVTESCKQDLRIVMKKISCKITAKFCTNLKSVREIGKLWLFCWHRSDTDKPIIGTIKKMQILSVIHYYKSYLTCIIHMLSIKYLYIHSSSTKQSMLRYTRIGIQRLSYHPIRSTAMESVGTIAYNRVCIAKENTVVK